MRVDYLGFYPFRYNYFNICFVSIIAFIWVWLNYEFIHVNQLNHNSNVFQWIY